MSETNYFRLIEAYYDGSIDPLQKAMLESKIQTDPLLRAEFDLQSQIIEGIADVRKHELKQRLSAIDVNGTGSFLLGSGVKWLAAGLSVAVIFSVWLYWFTNTSENTDSIHLQNKDLMAVNESNYPPIPTVLKKNLLEENEEKEVGNNKSSTSKKEIDKIQNETLEENHTAKVKPQSLLTFQDDNLFTPATEKDFSKTIDRDVNRNMVSETKIEFLDPIQESSHYHYKYFNNKLYLFGNFNNEPYQILELHNKGKKQLFLSYQKTIYHIESGKIDITPLTEVTDQMLILELNMILNE